MKLFNMSFLAVLFLIAMFGFILPTFFSSNSTELNLIGFGIIAGMVYGLGVAVVKTISKGEHK